MKRLLFLVLILFHTTLGFSQNRIGFKLGYHLSDMVFDTGTQTGSTSSLSSFHAGFLVEISLSKLFYARPGISILQKGAALSSGGTPIELNPVYIEIPVNIISKIELGNGKLFLGGGPYGAVGFGGSVTTNTTYNGGSMDHPIVYGSDPDKHDLKKFDFGINLLTGYEINRNFSVDVGYGIGLANIWPPSNGSLKNKIMSMSIGITL